MEPETQLTNQQAAHECDGIAARYEALAREHAHLRILSAAYRQAASAERLLAETLRLDSPS